MKRFVVPFCDAMTLAAKGVLGVCIAVIVFITLLAVWQRYVMDNPLSWVEQVSNMIFIWVVFIGAAVLYRQNLHIGVDAFLMSLNDRHRNLWRWIIEFANLTFIVVLFIASTKLTIGVMDNTNGALEISPAYYYIAAPISCLMMMIYFVEKIVDPDKRVPTGEAGEF